MSLRIPSQRVERGPHDLTTCEEVLAVVLRTTDGVVDESDVRRVARGDPGLMRYVRDTLNLFVHLGQVERVRRTLWITEPPAVGETTMEEELLRAHVAARVLGPWSVAVGPWALVLQGALPAHYLARSRGIRVCATPDPRRLATHAEHGRRAISGAVERSGPTIPTRHVTLVRGAPIAAITRPLTRAREVGWVGTSRFGVHVESLPDALLTVLEHPRLLGGHAEARDLVIPVLARVGMPGMLEAGARHPTLAVRRRLGFLLYDVLDRSDGTTQWLRGPCDELDRDEHLWWRIPAALRVDRRAGRPTLLEPHRIARGNLVRSLGIVDNRSAPLLPRRAVPV